MAAGGVFAPPAVRQSDREHAALLALARSCGDARIDVAVLQGVAGVCEHPPVCGRIRPGGVYPPGLAGIRCRTESVLSSTEP